MYQHCYSNEGMENLKILRAQCAKLVKYGRKIFLKTVKIKRNSDQNLHGDKFHFWFVHGGLLQSK